MEFAVKHLQVVGEVIVIIIKSGLKLRKNYYPLFLGKYEIEYLAASESNFPQLNETAKLLTRDNFMNTKEALKETQRQITGIASTLEMRKPSETNNKDGNIFPKPSEFFQNCEGNYLKPVFLSNGAAVNFTLAITKVENSWKSHLQSSEFALLPDVKRTQFPNGSISKRGKSGRAIILMEDEATQNTENILSSAKSLISPDGSDFLNHEILSDNKTGNCSKLSAPSEPKNQTQELLGNSSLAQRNRTHSDFHQFKNDPSETSIAKELRNASNQNESSSYVLGHSNNASAKSNFTINLNDKCMSPNPQSPLFTVLKPQSKYNTVKKANKNAKTNSLISQKYFSLHRKTNNSSALINHLHSPVLPSYTFQTNKNLIFESKVRQQMETENENKLFEAVPQRHKNDQQNTSENSQKMSAADAIFSAGKEPAAHCYWPPKTPIGASEFKVQPKFRHQIIKTIQESVRKKTRQRHKKAVVLKVPNLKCELDLEHMLIVSRSTGRIEKLLETYLKNETKMIIANQRAFCKLEQKITQCLIQQNLRLPDKSSSVDEISLKRTISKTSSTKERTKFTEGDKKSTENRGEKHDDKLVERSILYIFLVSFLSFASELEFPLFP